MKGAEHMTQHTDDTLTDVKEKIRTLWLEGDLEPIDQISDPSWRHGTRETWVFQLNDKFYQLHFRLSTDGECHELRDDNGEFASIQEVYPHQIPVTVYKTEPQQRS
jgi:hypothetical protein